jgi:hypothetical protein
MNITIITMNHIVCCGESGARINTRVLNHLKIFSVNKVKTIIPVRILKNGESTEL